MRDNRITYREATKALNPGDYVYVVSGDKIEKGAVTSISKRRIKTENMRLMYSEHRKSWFLTELFVRLAAKGEAK